MVSNINAQIISFSSSSFLSMVFQEQDTPLGKTDMKRPHPLPGIPSLWLTFLALIFLASLASGKDKIQAGPRTFPALSPERK